jgi:hypothetical protein
MKVRRQVLALVAVVISVAFALLGAPTNVGAQSQVIGDWRMDEARGSTRLLDSSGNGYHGTIGTDVSVGVRSSGATVHSFPYIGSTAPPDPAGRLHVIDQRTALNPGTADFAVELRFRNTHTHGNITQKGQSGASGGYWKVEVDDGLLSCVFSGTSASVAMKSKISVTDDVWRTVRCERKANEAVMFLDGVQQARPQVRTGSIANDWTLVVGGKSSCNSTEVQCDYFRGDLDYLKVERPNAPAPTTTTTTRPTTTTTRPTTTTTRPTTTTTVRPTTTTTVAPSSQLPVGRIDSVTVDGSTITVTGPASDPNGTPIARVEDVVEGRRTVIERWGAGGRYSVSYTGASGTHQVCVSLLDSPTRQAVPIGCSEAVVK